MPVIFARYSSTLFIVAIWSSGFAVVVVVGVVVVVVVASVVVAAVSAVVVVSAAPASSAVVVVASAIVVVVADDVLPALEESLSELPHPARSIAAASNTIIRLLILSFPFTHAC